ncbi:MAG TPA: hypothetical protein VNK91_02220 [Burkholderiaceae bacterium]|nr:hypothetical protein [Burkholderiaceae bacterium]
MILLACLTPLTAPAQGDQIPKAAVDALAKDLAQLHEAVLEAQRKQQAYEMAPARWPSLGVGQVTVMNPSTAVRAGANDKAAVLLTATKHQSFPVIDKAGEWYAIALPQQVHGVSAGWVPASDVVPSAGTIRLTAGGAQSTSLADGIFNNLAERAIRFRDAYRSNPYFSVSGFAVNVGVPPSVSINFDFR